MSEITFKHSDGNTDIDHVIRLTGGNITFIIENNAKLHNSKENIEDQLIWIDAGTFTLESGQLSVANANALVIGVRKSASVSIKGASLKGNACISADSTADVSIASCTLTAREYAVGIEGDGMYVNDILANGFAYQKEETDGTLKWIDDGGTKQKLGSGSFKVTKAPLQFEKQPKGEEVTYGETPGDLSAEAKVVDENSGLAGKTITYRWQQMENGSWQDTDIEDKVFPFSGRLPAGGHQYRCYATCGWCSLHSDTANVKVIPKTVTAKIEGTGVKEYDGTKVVPEGQLSVRLEGVIDTDVVSASALSWTYDSADPGTRTITAEVKLEGADAGNYQLASSSISAEGRITGTIPVTGLSLDKHTLSMTVGSSQQLTASILPENASDKNVSWTSDDPAAVYVDSSGYVTAVRAGRAVVTAATADGKYTDACLVTVSSGANSFTDQKLPFLKDVPYKKGWDVILSEVKKAAAGLGSRTVSIVMNDTSFVPDDIFTVVRDRDVTVEFDMGGGISWSVYGKDIADAAAGSVDLSVKAGTGKIPEDILNETAGVSAHLELSPVQYGPFGFTAVLAVRFGITQNGITIGTGETDTIAGMYANLFAYDPDQRSLEFICAGRIGDDGTAYLPADRAADWTIILSPYPMGGTAVPEDPQEPEENTKVYVRSVTLSKTVYTYSGKEKKPDVIAVDTAGKRVPEKYYTVSYQNNVKVGKAAAVIVFKDGCSGTVRKTFTIRPAGTSVKKIAALSGGFTVKWAKRAAQTSGYQIQYSRNGRFKGNSTRSVFVKKASITKKTVKKLKAGKKYYVRIRTYKKVKKDGESMTIYSTWSKRAALRVLYTRVR